MNLEASDELFVISLHFFKIALVINEKGIEVIECSGVRILS